MKSTKSSILWAVVAGAVASTMSAGCGSSPETVNAVDHSKTDAGAPEPPQADAGRVDAGRAQVDAAPEAPQDSGGESPDDCASFTPLPVDSVFLPTGWMGDTAGVISVGGSLGDSWGVCGACGAITIARTWA